MVGSKCANCTTPPIFLAVYNCTSNKNNIYGEVRVRLDAQEADVCQE